MPICKLLIFNKLCLFLSCSNRCLVPVSNMGVFANSVDQSKNTALANKKWSEVLKTCEQRGRCRKAESEREEIEANR